MKRIAILLLAALPLLTVAQVKIPKDANRFTYHQYDYGDVTDTTVVTVERVGDVITIITSEPEGEKIQGYCRTVTSVDYAADSITVTATYPDSTYYYRTGFTRGDLEWRVDGNRHTCSVNSNTLVFVMDEKAPVNVTPLPYYGLNKGVLRSFTRNGQKRLVLAKAEKVKWSAGVPPASADNLHDAVQTKGNRKKFTTRHNKKDPRALIGEIYKE
jgi:hypothetical protein